MVVVEQDSKNMRARYIGPGRATRSTPWCGKNLKRNAGAIALAADAMAPSFMTACPEGHHPLQKLNHPSRQRSGLKRQSYRFFFQPKRQSYRFYFQPI
jgi:hypothetical protein